MILVELSWKMRTSQPKPELRPRKINPTENDRVVLYYKTGRRLIDFSVPVYHVVCT